MYKTLNVTIIMATYNRAHLIEETLISIQNQTYQNWECLIIDDSGTDNTEKVIRSILVKDGRFKYFNRPEKYQKGLPGCRNYGLDLAKGDFIIFFDDDDIVHPQNLELCVEHLKSGKYDFCRYERSVFIGKFNYNYDFKKDYLTFEISNQDVYKLLSNELPFNSCAVMWKRSCFKNNQFNENLKYAEEWELYSRLLMKPHSKGVSIKKVLFFGRKHSESNTGEYYSGNEIRLNSEIKATVMVINNLDDQDLLSIKYIKLFLGLRKKTESKPIFDALLRAESLSLRNKLYVIFRYTFLPQLKYVYALKNRI